MNVSTTRFGSVEIDESRILTFPAGLLGFSNFTRFALLQPDEEGVFYWLQSLDTPELAFVVTDPTLWVPDYQATIRREQLEELALTAPEEAQVLVIANRYGDTLTGNLQGPLVINVRSRTGMQLVMADKRWTTRHEFIQLGERVHAASA